MRYLHLEEYRLLAMAFIPNPENKPCINHIDKNRINNDLSNLEWVTYRENNVHMYETRKTSSMYKGVTLCKQTKKWKASIRVGNKVINSKRFDKEIDAYYAKIDIEKSMNIY